MRGTPNPTSLYCNHNPEVLLQLQTLDLDYSPNPRSQLASFFMRILLYMGFTVFFNGSTRSRAEMSPLPIPRSGYYLHSTQVIFTNTSVPKHQVGVLIQEYIGTNYHQRS